MQYASKCWMFILGRGDLVMLFRLDKSRSFSYCSRYKVYTYFLEKQLPFFIR